MARPALLFLTVFLVHHLYAQPVQTIRGSVTDQSSDLPVAFASVILMQPGSPAGTVADSLGRFNISGIPVGRYDIRVSALGYESAVIRSVVVQSAKETFISVRLAGRTVMLDEVVLTPSVNKDQPLNPMATVSARMLSVEEARRYAGGFDDPARLASSFAGVSGNTEENGISVRGNAPKFVQWKMEGIEIPNPNHFGDLNTFGGGTLTALSSQMLANSDFLTGAFPAEYSNALSGVFDMSMRNGSGQKRAHTFQAGIIGIDASSEGPFRKGSGGSYLFNYRYSTLALLSGVLPENADGMRYQDVSFKLHLPSRKAGIFSIWGIGLADRAGAKAKTDPGKWVYHDDPEENEIRQYMGATGISHRYFFKNDLFVKTTIAATASGTSWNTEQLDDGLTLRPKSDIRNDHYQFVFSSFINKKFSARHTNRTGVLVTGMLYNMALKNSTAPGRPMSDIVSERGFSTVISGYTSSSVSLSGSMRMNIGLSSQLFTLNGHYTVEPRLGFRQQIGPNQSVGLAYGLHSRLERLHYYFSNSLSTGGKSINKNLDFTKAHHLVLSYDRNLSDFIRLKVEPYYQHLFAVPVIADSSFSLLNVQNDWFFAEKLQNTGKGRNYGIDLTLEKFMSRGYYYLITASLFNSEYTGGDGVWRSTRFNRNFVVNTLFGKEWQVGKSRQNSLGLNARVRYQGGSRFSPVDETASHHARQIFYDETKAFSRQAQPVFNLHLTASYTVNGRKNSRELALKLLNVTGQPDFYGYRFNLKTNSIEKDLVSVIIPNLSYRVEF